MIKKIITSGVITVVSTFNSISCPAAYGIDAIKQIQERKVFDKCLTEFDSVFDLEFSHLSFESKDDGSLVSSLEKSIERHFGEFMKRETPWASFQGEEGYSHSAETHQDEEYRWYIDPIDGTVSFKNGLDTYALTFTLVRKRDPLATLIYVPQRREYYYAYKGCGAFHVEMLSNVSQQIKIQDTHLDKHMIVARSDDYAFDYLNRADLILRCRQVPAVVRTYTDAFAYTQVALGKYQAKLDAAAALWDLYPAYLLIREAGGEFMIYMAPTPTSDLFCSCLSGSKAAVQIIRQHIDSQELGEPYVNRIPENDEVVCND